MRASFERAVRRQQKHATASSRRSLKVVRARTAQRKRKSARGA
jgi:hypothetical protein